jgi:hypothetical protein
LCQSGATSGTCFCQAENIQSLNINSQMRIQLCVNEWEIIQVFILYL